MYEEIAGWLLRKKVLNFGQANMIKVMIYQFKITSPESKDFLLEVEADGGHTFFEFHLIIQQSAGFESHQLASFFMPDPFGRKVREISLLDAGFSGGAYHIMQKTYIGSVINKNQLPFYYTYDFINDRSFNIDLTGCVMKRNLKEPVVTLKQGEAPVQIFDEDVVVQEPAKNLEEEVLMDFGILDDYSEIYGEMEDY